MLRRGGTQKNRAKVFAQKKGKKKVMTATNKCYNFVGFRCYSVQKRNFWKAKWVKERAKWVKERAKWVKERAKWVNRKTKIGDLSSIKEKQNRKGKKNYLGLVEVLNNHPQNFKFIYRSVAWSKIPAASEMQDFHYFACP